MTTLLGLFRDRILQEESFPPARARNALRPLTFRACQCPAIDPTDGFQRRTADAAYAELCNAGLTIVANGLTEQQKCL